MAQLGKYQADVVVLQEIQLRDKGQPHGSVQGDHSESFVAGMRSLGYAGHVEKAKGPLAVGVFWRDAHVRCTWIQAVDMRSISHKSACIVGLQFAHADVAVCAVHLTVPMGRGAVYDDKSQHRELGLCLETLGEKCAAARAHATRPLHTVVAGDFNSLATSQSRVLARLTGDGYSSAYAAVLGKEPAYTTVNLESSFVGTVDYIFSSPGLRAVGVLDVPPKRPKALPDRHVPSDHLPLVANLDMGSS